MENKIIQGDALEELKKLPEKSINMCMTSPPYWSLRDYGTSTETIWDGDENCEHDFNIKERKIHSGTTKSKIYGDNSGHLNEYSSKDGFCNKCGAWKGQLGLEPTFDLYIKHLCDIFDEVKRVLRDDGTCFVDIGDTYGGSGGSSGHKEDTKNLGYNTQDMGAVAGGTKTYQAKSLVMIPMRFAIEMVNRGWILRNTIIWYKPNCMPSSVKDRFTVDFEYIFFFSKKKKYYFETQREGNNEYFKDVSTPKSFGGSGHIGNNFANRKDSPIVHTIGRNKRTVWRICPKPFKEAHFAVYPEELCKIPISAGVPYKVCPKCNKGLTKEEFENAKVL